MQIAQPFPQSPNNQPLNSLPSVPTCLALAVTYDATIDTSTTLNLNVATTYLEVSAIDKGIFMKWGATASSTSFDEFIPANQTKVFGVISGQTSVQFIQETATAKLVAIEK